MSWQTKHERVPAKVGTMPMTVWIDKPTAEQVMSGTMKKDDRIYWYEAEWGQKCTGLVEEIRINEDGALSLLMVTRF